MLDALDQQLVDKNFAARAGAVVGTHSQSLSSV
jgi:hypothetical protein